MRRRHFTSLLGAAGVVLWGGRAETAELLISDTHSHYMLRPQDQSCLKCELGDARVSLVSWALGSDGPFIQRLPNGAMQVNLKATPEQYREVYTRMLRGMGARIRRENLRLAKTSADVDLALAGELHLVLSTEGAHFWAVNWLTWTRSMRKAYGKLVWVILSRATCSIFVPRCPGWAD